jgi:hypothetical protein
MPTAGPNDPILVGAGDIARCTRQEDEQTAELIDQVVATGIETVVFTAGDNAYESGTIEEYEQCYAPSWGRHKDRTRPAIGNHEYYTGTAEGYFTYFGGIVGEPDKGYYSYDLGLWHIIVLNTSNHCQLISCDRASAQEDWLRADLAATKAACTLAIWHDPLFTSAREGGARYLQPFWDALYEFGADVIVNGHYHSYERFAPQTPDGIQDSAFGIRQFVVGTGGDSLRGFEAIPAHHTEVRDDATHGVIRFTLHPAGYDWEFMPLPGSVFKDSGSGVCHEAPPIVPE